MKLAFLGRPISYATAFSIWIHAVLLFGIGVSLPDPNRLAKSLKPLEVTLVNSRTRTPPPKADALAQANLDGGGNTPEDKYASTPLPTLIDGQKFSPQQSAKRVQQLEQEAKRLLTQIQSTHSVVKKHKPKKKQVATDSGEDLVQRSLEIARLEARIDKNFSTYQKFPKRAHYPSERTRKAVYAQYVEAWRIKIERWGNMNYPEEARRRHIYGSLVLTVSIRPDGSVESMEVNNPSGHPILDAAAMHIVKLASPFPHIPAAILKDFPDGLTITRTWVFTPADRLRGE